MFYVKKDTGTFVFRFQLVDATDGWNPETNKTYADIGAAYSILNMPMVDITPTLIPGDFRELGNGWYTLAFVDAHIGPVTLTAIAGPIIVQVYCDGCRSYSDTGYVLPADTYDAMFSTGIYNYLLDGVTVSDTLQSMAAVLYGTTTIAGKSVQFHKRDGETPKVQVAMGSTSGQRTSSVIY